MTHQEVGPNDIDSPHVDIFVRSNICRNGINYAAVEDLSFQHPYQRVGRHLGNQGHSVLGQAPAQPAIFLNGSRAVWLFCIEGTKLGNVAMHHAWD